MSWSLQVYRLVPDPTEPGLFCGKDELSLGGVPLLVKSDSGFEPRATSELQEIFDAAYGADSEISAVSRAAGLWSIARALTNGDHLRATITSLMLQLPDIQPMGVSRLKRLSIVAKYDDGELRDWRGRWTSGGGQEPGEASRQRGRWPDIHREHPNITPAQVAIPLPPPLLGGTLGLPKPKKDDDDIIFPPTLPYPGVGPATDDGVYADSRAAANDNTPRMCPDPSFEPGSVGRTLEQLHYQAQINGLPLGYHVILNKVGYDGCRESDGAMLEAKYGNACFINIPRADFEKLDGYRETINQAFKQNYLSLGRRVEWYFSDPDVAVFWRAEFKLRGYDKIRVFYHPYSDLYSPGFNKLRETFKLRAA